MIRVSDKVNCCGCNACGDICAHSAISFRTDEEGFWYPVVDQAKCVNCGLCEKVCPVINIKELKHNDLPQSICYAAEHKNLEVVFDSTSGGLFTALAEIVYKQGGYVGGAIYNEDYKSVRHFISSDRNDLPRLRSSKYLQSYASGFYSDIRALLGKGEKVLVCGTPCQMAALRAFLGKDYENLIIVDFICRGINSPKVWAKYLDSYEERYGSKVIWAKSKSKEYGWRNLTQKVILEDGRHIYETRDDNNFVKGYLFTGAYCRPSCYECKFKGYPRMSDITLADFWGVEKFAKSMDKDLGTSLVMLNSQKGVSFFEQVMSRIKSVEVPFDKIAPENPALVRPLPHTKVDRALFFKDLDSMPFQDVAKKYITANQGSVSLRRWLKNTFRYAYRIAGVTHLNPKAVWQFLRYNSYRDIVGHNVMIPSPHCVINIAEGASVVKSGVSILGDKGNFGKSRIETRLYVGRGGKLCLGPGTSIGYGANIEVFPGASLDFKGHNGSNIGLTVICGESIEIGTGVMIGRNVTIRDNNGGHYINRQGYRNSKPVVIGDKAWLCEQCTVMNGVKIGDGAIVGAKSFVIRNVPAHSMVSGHPAEVVDEDVLWKY